MTCLFTNNYILEDDDLIPFYIFDHSVQVTNHEILIGCKNVPFSRDYDKTNICMSICPHIHTIIGLGNLTEDYI